MTLNREIPDHVDFEQFWVKLIKPNGVIITQFDHYSFGNMFKPEAANIFSKWKDLKVKFDINRKPEKTQSMIDELRGYEQALIGIDPSLDAEEIDNARDRATRIVDLRK